jgi:phage FluMu gp28-like protein
MTEEFLNHFLPYQQDWLKCPDLYKFGLWARQTGKDYTCAGEAVHDCATNKDRHWLILACGERQARESLLKAKEWAHQLVEKRRRKYSGVRRESGTEILFENGSRITALPAKPGTVRGYSANVILTEFAFHDDVEAMWKAIFPSVSNPMRGGPKKLRIISTPNGQGDFFHKLWNDSAIFWKQKITIHQAHAQELKVDIQTLRAGILDPDAWAQEYECEFMDQSSVLLPYELIEQCESPGATETSSPDGLSTRSGELFMGIDFGRRHDLTVCWVLEKVGDDLWTREVLALSRTPTPAQLQELRPRAQRARRICMDYTGAGIGLGDSLAEEFGKSGNSTWDGKVELCTFTAALKEEIFVKLRAAFERRKLWIPSSRQIRDDLHGVHRTVSSSGHIGYRAMHSPDGHSDRCTALALALRAAQNAPITACASSVGPRYRY